MDLATSDNYLATIANRIRAIAERHADVPEGNVDDLFLSYAVLAMAKGERVAEADVHNAWVAWMLSRDPTHEALVPFSELAEATARSDKPFRNAIRAVAGEMREVIATMQDESHDASSQ